MTIDVAFHDDNAMEYCYLSDLVFCVGSQLRARRGEGAESVIAEQEQPEEKRTVYSSLPSLGISRELSRVKSSFFLSQANTLVDQDEREER